MKIKLENWFYCELCRTVAYKFECCGNTSCNGSGCKACSDLWEYVHELIDNGEAPPQESLPVHRNPFDVLLEEDKIRGM